MLGRCGGFDRRAGVRPASPTVGRSAAANRAQGPHQAGSVARQFRADTKLTFDDMCREAARLGCYGFDLIDPADWPTLRKHGLEPLIAGAGPVTFENGHHPPRGARRAREGDLRPHIDMCARPGRQDDHHDRRPTPRHAVRAGRRQRRRVLEPHQRPARGSRRDARDREHEQSASRSALRPRRPDLRPLGVGCRRLRARQLARTSSSSAISITCRSWTATSRRTFATRSSGSRTSTPRVCRRATRSTSARR